MSKTQFMVGDVLDFFREVVETDFDGRIMPVESKGQTSWKISIHNKVSWILGFQAGAGRNELEQDSILLRQLIGKPEEDLFFHSALAFYELLRWTSNHEEIEWSMAA